MRLCYAVFHYDGRVADPAPARYLDAVPLHRYLPQAMAARGHGVDVAHLYPYDMDYVEGGVHHHFVASGRVARGLAWGVGRLRRRDPVVYEVALRLIETIRRLDPAVVHVHGLGLNLNLALLYRCLGPGGPPVVVHSHGGYPAASRVGRMLQRANLHRAARVLFTTHAHAEPFLQAGLLRDKTQVVEVMETSSHFQPRPREVARQQTGMVGAPVFLSVGRLHPIKDPMTTLRGFELVLRVWPQAQFYLYYTTDELLAELRAYVEARPALAAHVHFRGRAPFECMETVYNSADFLLQASQREFSGCAILEAMACGVVPIVSDIPSFRAMTDDGRNGILFPRQQPSVLAERVLAHDLAELPAWSSAVRGWFDQSLSFQAMAQRLDRLYATLV